MDKDVSTLERKPGERRSWPAFLINRNFTFVWIGQSLSGCGNTIFSTALILWITTDIARGQSWAPLVISGMLAASMLPSLFIGPLVGVFVDRWDKRRIVLWTTAIPALLITLFLALLNWPFWGSNSGSFLLIWVIYVLLFCMSVSDQFASAAYLAFIGDIVVEEKRTRAFGLMETTRYLNRLLGAPIGALLFIGLGIHWVLLLDLLSFVFPFVAVLTVRLMEIASHEATSKERHGYVQALIEGLRFYKGNRVLITITVTSVVIFLGVGAHNALDIFFITRNLHAPAKSLGFYEGAWGAGLLAGSLATHLFVFRLGQRRIYWISVLAFGIAATIYACVSSFWLAMIFGFLMGFFNALFNVVAGPLILETTPREFIGRIIAIFSPALILASLISTSLSGYLISTVMGALQITIFGYSLNGINIIYLCAGLLPMLASIYAARNLSHGTRSSQ